MGKGILLNDNGDLVILNKSLLLGDTLVQDASIALECNQGDLKEDPLLGSNLVRLIRKRASPGEINRIVKITLARAGVDYEKIQDKLNILINGKNENK